jgi:hypothetical protein
MIRIDFNIKQERLRGQTSIHNIFIENNMQVYKDKSLKLKDKGYQLFNIGALASKRGNHTLRT